jgi:hypothetical protein
MSDKVQLGVFMDYVRSRDFDIKIGDYKGYDGLKIAVGMSILF